MVLEVVEEDVVHMVGEEVVGEEVHHRQQQLQHLEDQELRELQEEGELQPLLWHCGDVRDEHLCDEY